jgi:hypothetical protein
MSFGIVKGVQNEVTIPTKGICIPVDRYDDRRILLRANSTIKLDISGIASYGDMNETYQFVADLVKYPNILAEGTQHKYSLYDESLNLIEEITFTVGASFTVSMSSAVSNSLQIKNLVQFDYGLIDQGKINVTANTAGIKYRHVFSFDLDGFGGVNKFPFLHPGNLIKKNRKYEDGRVKVILIVPEFEKVDTSTCGCSDKTGAMLSNKKYFQYALASDYEKHKNPTTPILAGGNMFGTSYNWLQESTDHIGYHIQTNDLINMSGDPLKRSIVKSIDGYDFSVDASFGNGTQSYLNHVWSPSSVSWKTGGELNLFTGAQDVYDEDLLYVETLYLKNPQSFDIPLKVLIGA